MATASHENKHVSFQISKCGVGFGNLRQFVNSCSPQGKEERQIGRVH